MNVYNYTGKTWTKTGGLGSMKGNRLGDAEDMKRNQRDESLWQRQRTKETYVPVLLLNTRRGLTYLNKR